MFAFLRCLLLGLVLHDLVVEVVERLLLRGGSHPLVHLPLLLLSVEPRVRVRRRVQGTDAHESQGRLRIILLLLLLLTRVKYRRLLLLVVTLGVLAAGLGPLLPTSRSVNFSARLPMPSRVHHRRLLPLLSCRLLSVNFSALYHR